MRIPQILTHALAALMFVQGLTGRFFDEQYRDGELIKSTWIGNDWVTLIIGIPLLVAASAAAATGSQRALLLWLGMLGYALYNYAFYLFGAALNAFFPLYVLALIVSAVTLILMLSQMDVTVTAERFDVRTPVRLVGGFLLFVGIGLACVWIAVWAAHVFAGRPTPIDREAFKLVAALDLTLMVPALTAGGMLLLRKAPWGYVIAVVASVQGALYLLVLTVNSIVAIRDGLASAPGELPVWGALAVLTAAAALVLLGSVRRERATG
jgi:hypothetical protein